MAVGPIISPPAEPYNCVENLSQVQRDNDQNMVTLNKSEITTRILYDRVAHMAGLESFGNSSLNNTSSVAHFLQAYYELHVANYDNTGAEPCRELLRSNALYHSSRNRILMGGLRYRFNYIDTNAVRNSQMVFPAYRGGPLYDVFPRTGSPYLEREVMVGAALVDTLRGGSASFVLDPASCFSNCGSALVSANVAFGDGRATQVCLPGQPVAVTYSTTGRKTLSFTFVYADGRRLSTRSAFYVKRVSCLGCRTATASDGVPCRTVRLRASRAFQGFFGEADISYYYSLLPLKPCDATTPVNVTKPVIVIDGFDHDDERKAPDIFNSNLSYTNGSQVGNLGTELANQGYDVVIMNMPNLYRTVTTTVRGVPNTYQTFDRHGGSDYIERNGLVLVSLIEALNAQLQAAGSTEQLVVVGPSMGGQIARYALAYMERNTLVHNTRLYIALDSPHNGANIPIGLQRFVRHYADLTGDGKLVTNLEKINSPASGEMTLQHYNFNDNNEATTPFTPHPWRTNYINNLNALTPGGFPGNVRRVAVTNGALNGGKQRNQTGQIINDGEPAVRLEVQGNPSSVWGLFVRATKTASATIAFSPGYGATTTVLSTYKLGSGDRDYNAVGPVNSCGVDASPGGYKNFFSGRWSKAW